MVIDLLLTAGEKGVDFIRKVFDKTDDVDGLTEKNLRAFLEDRGVSDLLMYRYYEEDEDGVGIYTMADGRRGFIFRFNAPVFLTDEVETKLMALFESFTINGTLLQISTFVSQNISSYLEYFKQQHPCQVNVTNAEILKDVVDNRARFLKKMTRQNMFKGLKFRIKDYINLLAITYPPHIDIDTIKMEYEMVKDFLKDMGGRNFSADELITMLREFFHNDKDDESWNSKYDTLKALNHQIVAGGVEVKLNREKNHKGFIINDTNYVTTLTTKQFPTTLSAAEFSDLFYDKYGNEINLPINGPYFVTLTILFEDVDKIKEKALSKLTHDLGEIRKFDLRTIERNPEMKERLNEVKEQIKAIKVHNEYPLKAMWSIAIFDTDKKNLIQSVSAIKERFRRIGWYLAEETFPHIALFTSLFSLPLQYSETVADFLKRFDLLFKSNNTAIAPLIGDFRGYGIGHIPYIGRSGQLIWWDAFAEGTENYNVVATGSSGSGKSFTFNDVIVMNLAKNAKVRVIDSLPSYKRITELLGGQYTEFTEDKRICLNFFTNILTKKDPETGEEIKIKDESGREYPVIMEEDMATIIPLIAMMARLDRVVVSNSSEISSVNDSADASFLAAMFEEAVTISFRAKGRSAGMYDVRKYLIEKRDEYKQQGYQHQAELLQSVVEGLRPFAEPDGVYYQYFNGPANFNFDKDLIVVELSALEQKGIIYPVVLMGLANMIVNEFFGDETRQKFLIIDEFWKFKDNLIVATFTEELARKVRKMRGSLITITQSPDDYKANKRMEALYYNSSWKFSIGRSNGTTGLGAFADRLLRTVAPHFPLFGENAIFTSTSMSINRNKVDPLCKWLYETSDKGKAAIQSIRREFGLDEIEAVKFLAIKEEYPQKSPNEILKEIGVLNEKELQAKERAIRERQNKIKEALLQAIEFNEVNFGQIPIVDINQDIFGYEIAGVLKIDDEVIKYGEVYPILKETNNLEKFDMLIVKKAIQYYSYQNANFSVNLNIETILNKKNFEEIIAFAKDLNALDLMIIELNLKRVEERDFERINSVLREFKNYNVRISNDNITLDTSFSKIISFDIDYIKIDGNLVKSAFLKNNSQYVLFLEAIVTLSQKSNLDVIFNHIETEDIFTKCIEIGGKLFEGFYFEKEEII